MDLTGIVGMDKAKMEKGWKQFNKRYPNAPGIFVVSRIGFNRDHTEAVMYAAKACGNLCGDGQYVWLVKRDGVLDCRWADDGVDRVTSPRNSDLLSPRL